MKSELERIGYLGSVPASYRSTPIAAHFELHIEQGPILEAQRQKIGVVKGVQAYRWYTIDVTGRGKGPPRAISTRGPVQLILVQMPTPAQRPSPPAPTRFCSRPG